MLEGGKKEREKERDGKVFINSSETVEEADLGPVVF